MVKSNNTQVTISAAMLNCFKQVLFSQTNGVDLSPIVEDLGGEDMTAVAVALAYKGIKPEIDTAPRFDTEYMDTYAKYEFKSYSVIKDLVLVNKVHFTLNNDTHTWIKDHSRDIEIPLSTWLNTPTSEEDIKAKILDRCEHVNK
jgi:hypothetical protein